ncbi:MAG: hypothetical protein ACLPR9_07725 [Acidimicrobiales bacterium]
MIRKILVVAAAIAMPVSIIAVTGTVAGAKTVVPPDPAVTCSVAGTVNFAGPGLSAAGSTEPYKTSVSTTSPTVFGNGCSGGGTANSITTKSTKCAKKLGKTQPASNPACANNVPASYGEYGYDSWANFTAAGTTSIQKSLKKLDFTINGIAYLTKTTAAAVVYPGAACGADSTGFALTGTVSGPKQDKGQTSTLTVCLGAITGTDLGVESTFLLAAVLQQGTVATAAFDPTLSTVHVGP